MKRVLLTGASGFIGRHTAALLAARGYEVHAVSTQVQMEDQPGMRWHQADLLESAEVARLLAEVCPTHLLHFAWYAEPGKFWRSSENFCWLEASLVLLRHFRDHGGRRVVMAGSCAEYDWDYGFCSENVTPCRPGTPYGVCKHALQETLRSYSAENGLSSAWGRIFFLYGPGEHPARLVASVVKALQKGEEARCTHGRQIRDFLHVADVAGAFVTLLDSEVEGVLNVASGHAVTLREVVLQVADCLNERGSVNFGALPAAEAEPPLLVADVRRISNELQWAPKFDLGAGIAQTVRSWQTRDAK